MILGVDPGMSGALAWVSRDGHLIETADMPTIEVRGRRRMDAGTLVMMLATRQVDRVIVEGVSAMPGQGVASTFAFGYAAGLIEGALSALNMPFTVIPAAQWKRKAGVSADKGAARQMAQRLWPGSRDFRRAKDHGRADAALLARWGATQ